MIMDQLLESTYNAVLKGDMETVKNNVQEAIDVGLPLDQILNEGLISAMKKVGNLFEEGEYFVPEMLVAARAMQGGMTILKPLLVESDVQPAGKVIIGTVKGDLHDIGKNLVGMMLEGAGFEVRDIGVDVTPEKFIEALGEGNTDIVAMSALLTTTMSHMKTTIDAINEAGLRDKVKIIVGGAPLTKSYADDIGADGFAPDASQAASLAKSFVDG
jgi:5-methyltetrahydrofolate--homocysteine methyltransferase